MKMRKRQFGAHNLVQFLPCRFHLVVDPSWIRFRTIDLSINHRSMMGSDRKPLPLKQRTSSIDGRRDYTAATWLSLLGLLKTREYLVTVDHFSIWKRHLAWAIENGKDLREYMTQRYASSMIFMSLLLSTELNVLFNSAGVTTQVRQSLMHERHDTVSFWVGIVIIFSAILTLLSLISTFTAYQAHIKVI